MNGFEKIKALLIYEFNERTLFMNSDELKRLKKIEKSRKINSLYDEFLENSPIWVFKESEAVEFAKHLIKYNAIFKFYKKTLLHPGNLGMWEPYKEEEVWVFENHGMKVL